MMEKTEEKEHPLTDTTRATEPFRFNVPTKDTTKKQLGWLFWPCLVLLLLAVAGFIYRVSIRGTGVQLELFQQMLIGLTIPFGIVGLLGVIRFGAILLKLDDSVVESSYRDAAETFRQVYGFKDGYTLEKTPDYTLSNQLVGNLTPEELNNGKGDIIWKGQPVPYLLDDQAVKLQLVWDRTGWRVMNTTDENNPTEVPRIN